MPLQALAQTQAGYDVGVGPLTIGPSTQMREIQWAISYPYSAKYHIAKLDKSGNVAWDSQDITAQPGSDGLDKCYGIQFKSFDPAHPTTVIIIGFFHDDPVPKGFIASSLVFTTGGGTTPSAVFTTGDYKVSAQAANHVDPAGGQWLLCDGSTIPAQYTTLIALLGANLPDAPGRVLVMQGTNADVNAIGKSDGNADLNRTPLHHHTYDRPDAPTAFAVGPGGLSGVQDRHTGNTSGGTPLNTPAYIVPGNLFVHT